MDLMVLAAQRWVNETYKGKKGYEVVEETGKTGWPTMRSLIRALQIEEGIGEPNGSFGPTTTKLCPTVSASTKNQNLIKIVQSALYCKGYNPSAISGNYGPNTQEAVFKLQSDAGLPITDGVVTPMIFKALLSMDAYVLLSKGDPKIRTIQRGLNNKYYKTIGVMPCDGIYSRGTNTALIYGLQIEEGIAGANGHFGPGTSSHCPVLKQGDNSRFVTILKYALYCNNQDAQSFTTSFDAATKSAVYEFQKFSGLNATGVADLQTWKSLLISTGDPSRKGKACDCATRLTPAKAKSIKAAGYDIVGRYLANVPGGLDKKLTSSELSTIFAAGLRVFPIFQLAANKRDYFTSARGTSDAKQAIQAAMEFGFTEDTIIYFAVDFDAMDYDVDVAILPYFKSVKAEFDKNNFRNYKIGIYAPRNVCSRVSNAGCASASFVCDMSTGFSGNLGYPLPKNWAFDQISTIKVGSGDGSIEIDNNICSGRDNGVSRVSENKVLVKNGIIDLILDKKYEIDPKIGFSKSFKVVIPGFGQISATTKVVKNKGDKVLSYPLSYESIKKDCQNQILSMSVIKPKVMDLTDRFKNLDIDELSIKSGGVTYMPPYNVTVTALTIEAVKKIPNNPELLIIETISLSRDIDFNPTNLSGLNEQEAMSVVALSVLSSSAAHKYELLQEYGKLPEAYMDSNSLLEIAKEYGKDIQELTVTAAIVFILVKFGEAVLFVLI